MGSGGRLVVRVCGGTYATTGRLAGTSAVTGLMRVLCLVGLEMACQDPWLALRSYRLNCSVRR